MPLLLSNVPTHSPNILILSAYDVGGASIAAIRQHLAFLQNGMQSRLLTLHKTSGNIAEHYQFSPVAGWANQMKLKLAKRKVHRLQTSLKLPPGISLSGEFSMPVAPYDVTSSPHWAWADVVILHWVNEWVAFKALLEKANRKPMIWVMHDMHAFSGGCHYNHGCEGLTATCTNCPLLIDSNQPGLAHRFWKSKKEAMEKHRPNLTIAAPSQWMVNWSLKSSLFSKLPHHAIFNGVDTQIFKPIRTEICREFLGIPQDKEVLLCVIQSIEDHRKGFRYLVEALQLVQNPTRYVLCTVGKLHNLPTMEVRHLHLGTLVDERMMAIVYNAANLFVHPAIEDNLPNVVVESLSCGVPVAGFAIGGMPEMVQPGTNGFLAHKISGKALLESMLHTLDTGFAKEKIAAAAASVFGLKTHAIRFSQLIEDVIAKTAQ